MTCNFPGKWFTSFHTTFAPPQFEPQPRGVTFIQSNYIGDGVHGNFEAVVRVAPAIATTPDHLDFWFLDSRTSVWNGPLALVADGKPMDGVTGDPVLIQGNCCSPTGSRSPGWRATPSSFRGTGVGWGILNCWCPR
jgi:hypothetical protein